MESFNLTTQPASEVLQYCPPGFKEFWNSAETFILNLVLIVCLVGIAANVVNLLIFLSPKMRSNPFNLILSFIAATDIVVLLTFVPQYFAKLPSVRENDPLYTVVAWLFHEYTLAVFHLLSVWLTVALGVWRYITVLHPHTSRRICTRRNAFIVFFVFLGLNVIITSPAYSDASIIEDETKERCGRRYCDVWSERNFKRDLDFWYQSGSKIVTFIILLFVTIRIIPVLFEARRRRLQLKGNKKTGKDRKEEREASTSLMLVVVLILFQVTELPPCVLYILEIFVQAGPDYYAQCRGPLHYVILLMYYLTGAFNFVIYVTINKSFRDRLMVLLGRGKEEVVTSTETVESSNATTNLNVSVTRG